MPRLIRPSFKQKKFAQEYIKHGNAQKAALTAYDTTKKNSANVIGYNNLNSPTVRTYMKKIMEKQGLTDDKIAEKLNAIVDAGTTKHALKATTSREALRALEVTAKLKDIFPAEKRQIESKTAILNLDLQNKTDEQLQQTLNELVEEAKSFRRLLKKNEKTTQKTVL